jgi:hypothetical protein
VDSDTDGSQGLTELGSSGSAVFDASHRVRGALSQGTKNPTCSMDTQSWYGRLDVAWSVLAPFLAATDPVYVDGSYAGSAERGTETEPFRTVLKGVYAVPEHGTVYIEAGTYSETFKLPKGMTLRARNGTVLIGP